MKKIKFQHCASTPLSASLARIRIFAFLLTTILLGVCTLSGYDIIYEKMNRLLDKSGLKKRIIDSQVKISGVLISAPSANQVLGSSTILVQGTATGKKIDFVEVRLDSTSGTGEWFKANGTSPWNFTFSDRTNRPYTVKVRAYNEKGYSAEVSVSFVVSNCGPLVRIISGPTNSLVKTNQPFSISLSVNENNGYWMTNEGAYNQFSPNITPVLTVSSNTLLQYFGKDKLGNTSSTQVKRYVFNTNTPVITIVSGPKTNVLVTNKAFTLKLTVNGNCGYWSTNGTVLTNLIQHLLKPFNSQLIPILD